jgi:hypothetical protein
LPRRSFALGLLLLGLMGPAPLTGQVVVNRPPSRFQIAPIAGYMWGGSLDTDDFEAAPAGELQLASSFAWGAILSFAPREFTAVEFTYLRQDTDIEFRPRGGGGGPSSGFSTNYIHIGGRYEFPTYGQFHPFVNGSLGMTIFDPKAENLDSETRFSLSLGAGGQYLFPPTQRFGLRADIHWWLTPVPSGEYGTWCDFYGCFVSEGTAWVNQGQVTGGVVFAF